MESELYTIKGENIFVVKSNGKINLSESLRVLNELIAEQRFEHCREIFFDLRNVDCQFTEADLFKMVYKVAIKGDVLPTKKKIAILVDRNQNFEDAKFIEYWVKQFGVSNLEVFVDYEEVNNWLDNDLNNMA
ncbi:MAG TPA: hypothetical protein ACFCUD_10140 [Cyclobacteriaceae bacterium]